ncbi:hypothetical protein [Vibrio scophthalmi]|uniref:Lipoprotein n=1 Tax=Vibrio scophthalmi LMG 19158 TaxID=870967 RepID=F9RQ15_9VIBR|nr:hypothetical protein [Vibrio scophthalmi]EGU34617.1 hypothetical protein VIS19158_11273 [Vibrio scophthalmi LMG 19158]
MTKLKLIFSLFALLLNGCAVFDGNEIPHTNLDYLKQDSFIPTLSYNVHANTDLVTLSESSETVHGVVEGELLNVLESSQYFRRISRVDSTADIFMNITITNSGSPIAVIPAFITGATLYIIPSWATDTFEVQANVISNNGLNKTYKFKDSTILVQWLPMAIFYPFNNFDTVPAVRKNIYRTLLKEMKNDGFFDRKTDVIECSKSGEKS